MCIITDKIGHACGFLLLNEFNSFIYCCKICQHEYKCGSDLEFHILSEHQVNNIGNETEFNSNSEAKQEDPSFEIDIGDVKVELDNNDQCETSKFEADNFEESSSDGINDPLSNDNGFDDKSEASVENPPEIHDGDSTQKNESNGLEVKKNKRKARRGSHKKRTPSGPFYCDMCNNKKLKHKKSLWNHMQLHLKRQVFDSTVKRYPAERIKTGPLYCEHCPGQVFRYLSHVREHMKVHVRNPLGKYCTICKVRVHNYDNHSKRVHSSEPYKCHICEAKFISYLGFKLHMKIHTGVRAYLCTYCGKSFSNPNVWRAHESRIHKKDKKFPCPKCEDRMFYSRSYLNQHMRFYHSTERPFKCETCGKDFKTQTCLRTHNLSHEGVTFQCRHCDKMFNRRENRRKHERNVHKIP